jgi:hypothetical protein
MLSPDVRSLYTNALLPPPGFVFDQAIATTFSVEPTTLLTVPLHLALLHRVQDAEQNGIALLEALRRVTERTTVYSERGRMQVPRKTHVLYALLESMVVEAKAPQGGAFHPKLWVLRFVVPDSDEPPLLRLLILSRNLTEDRSWDLLLQLEGQPGGQYVAANRELGELIRDLPTMAVGDVSEMRRAQAALLGDEVRRTHWELPAGFESVVFHVLGRKRGRWLPPRSSELAVISPFLTAPALAELRETTGRLVAVISRPEELDALTAVERSIAEKCWVLDEAAESEDGEALEYRDVLGLHAKAFVLRCGWDTKLFVGSANATSAALLAGTNIEVLAELSGKRTKVKGIEEMLGADGLGSVLMEYQPPEAPVPADAELQAAEKALEVARGTLAGSRLSIRCERAEDEWRLVLQGQERVPLQGIARLRAWPLTVSEELAADAWGLLSEGHAVLGRFSAASITGLIAFELVAAARPETTLRFALNLPVEGLPDERDAAILRTVVRNREGFLRYLLLLLGDLAPGEPPVQELTGRGSGASGWGSGAMDEMPLLEDLARAFSRDRARLREVGRVIERLQGSAEGEQIVPQEFLELWRVFKQALGAEAGEKEVPSVSEGEK